VERVIIPDVNLLVYAYDSLSRFHAKASEWWAACLSGNQYVGISWAVALKFVRVWTNPRVFANPMTVDQAASHVESWLARPLVQVLNPGPRHAELVFRFLRAAGEGGNLTTDAHLAALAMESRGIVYTADTDFLRFAGVKWVNPLE